MKKIFTLLAISLVLVLPIVSCSADDESAKQAQTDRDSLEIPGDENNSSIQHNQLALYASATQVPVGTLVTFTTNLNGINVTNEVTYYVNNIEVGGNSIASTLNGTFQVQAKLEGYIDSPIVTVVYGNGTNPNPDPDPNPNPNGSFIFNGQNHTVTTNILVLEAIDYLPGSTTEARGFWTSIVTNNANIGQATVGAFIEFTTMFTITDPNTGTGTLTLPNGTSEVYQGISQLLVNNQLTNDITGSGTIHYTPNFNLDGTSNSFTSTISFETNNLQINYNGEFSHIDNTEEGARSQRPASNAIQKVKSTIKKGTHSKTTQKLKLKQQF
nr:hypothetical protein [uncultured Flavobacterium sp.]